MVLWGMAWCGMVRYGMVYRIVNRIMDRAMNRNVYRVVYGELLE